MRIIGLNARGKEIRLTLPHFHAQVPFPHEATMTKREGGMLLERKREQLLSSLQRRIATREEDEAELDLSSLDKVSGKEEVG